MDLDYKPNSMKSKKENAEKRKVPPLKTVAQGKVKKSSALDLITSSFSKEELKDKFLNEMIVPRVKDFVYKTGSDTLFTILNILESGLGMVVYGETNYSKNGIGNRKRNGGWTSYDSMYSDRFGSAISKKEPSNAGVTRKNIDDMRQVIVPSRGDSVKVINGLRDTLDQYGIVTVAQLYMLINQSVDNFTYHNYGWTNIDNVSVTMTRDGYLIRLPKPKPID